ncbi:DsbA family protein [Candidatus Woesearchaeota archaeon]|nr:DsbA family protein [Candidatus Woesearchaeota archaeon]
MNKDNFFFILALLGILMLIALVLNIDKLFPLPTEEETLTHLASLDQKSTERGTNPEAPVLLEEFSDFQCPYCKAAVPLLQELNQKYGDTLNIVYKHAPFLESHPQAGDAAEASECARQQEKFWAYHDLLFSHQDQLDLGSLKNYAAQLNLDTERFNTCLTQHEQAHVIERDLNEALERGIQGTPTFFINGIKVNGADKDQILLLIEQQLEAKR